MSVSIWDPISSSFVVVAWAKWLLAGPTQFSKFLPCRSSPLTLSLVRQDRDISYWNGCLTVSGSDTTRHTRILGPSQSQSCLLSLMMFLLLIAYHTPGCDALPPLPTFALSVSVNYFFSYQSPNPNCWMQAMNKVYKYVMLWYFSWPSFTLSQPASHLSVPPPPPPPPPSHCSAPSLYAEL